MESRGTTKERELDVLLVSMPFGPLLSPSLGLSLLKSVLVADGFSCRVLYPMLRFAEVIGSKLYVRISNGEPITYDLLGEWIFSAGLRESTSDEEQAYIEDVILKVPDSRLDGSSTPPPEFIEAFLSVRHRVVEFLDECVNEIRGLNPRVIGFTSVFQQHVASIALAKRLKEVMPEVPIIFGGANCEGIMGIELVHQFPFIDAVASGEGDLIIGNLIRSLLNDKHFLQIDGVYTQNSLPSLSDHGRVPNAPLVRNMDDLPYPDFQDYFLELAAHPVDEIFNPSIPFETSRGCWWGELKHCTFCGLNGDTMAFRSKSSRRAIEELRSLTSQYPGLMISVVDNILDMEYFKTFVPELAEENLNLQLFYEVKANLSKDQVRLLKKAGITIIQPGIESLSSDVLRLMRKGVRGVQNIQLLKWCKELGITPHWNIIWGFPGELADEYNHMAELAPLLSHLPPPSGGATIRLDRFSPNFDEAHSFGIKNIKPYPTYRHIFKFPDSVLFNLAYFFTFEYEIPQQVATYAKPLSDALQEWEKVYEESDLFSVDKGTALLLLDLRPIASRALTVLTGASKSLYLACDKIQTLDQIRRHLISDGYELDLSGIERLIDPLLKDKIFIHEDNRYLSLAIPLGQYSPSGKVMTKLLEMARSLSASNSGALSIPAYRPELELQEA
jgi:ribosomal peptide maturation radical SAM protein 1